MSIADINTDLRETHIIGSQTREKMVSPSLCPPLAAEGIVLVGLSEASPDFQFVRLSPRWGQILVCLSGMGRVWVDNSWKSCGPGLAYVTPPNITHAYAAETRWNVCWLQSPELWICPSPVPVLLRVDPVPLASAIAGLHREAMETEHSSLLSPWALLVGAYARRLLPSGSADTVDPRLRRLWDAVGTDLARPWDVASLAAYLGVGGEHLRRLCRRDLGRSPMQQVAFLRMRQATALLASESYTVEAVAAQVGYDNPFAFSTAFKRHFGVSPSGFRRGGTRSSNFLQEMLPLAANLSP